ncbi:MAG: hypothetical protein ACJAQ6_002057, partial [Arenicella sp.]
MSEISIERIQICCTSAPEAAEAYCILFGDPCWVGRYQLNETGGECLERGNSIWFALSNTTIELFDTSLRDSKLGLFSIVVENGCEPYSGSIYDSLCERQTVYISESGTQQQQRSYQSSIDDDSHYQLSLINKSTLTTPVLTTGDLSDMIRVDHIVLIAKQFETIDARFGAE